jgi:hypothetical protein
MLICGEFPLLSDSIRKSIDLFEYKRKLIPILNLQGDPKHFQTLCKNFHHE